MATTTVVEQKQLVKYETDGGLAIIQMDDAPANTYTYEMMQQLDTLILRARMDESVHVIVLRGAGEKFFSAGASIYCARPAAASNNRFSSLSLSSRGAVKAGSPVPKCSSTYCRRSHAADPTAAATSSRDGCSIVLPPHA